MQRSSRNPGDNLVRLRLVSPFDLDPPPDRGLQGRLDRVLKSVGAKTHLSVRARMITAISNTKFKTLAGEPVSLVGLHGKDELLVLGPDWAIENLGRGDEPNPTEVDSFIAEQKRTLEQQLELVGLLREVTSFMKNQSSRFRSLDARNEFKLVEIGWNERLPNFLHRPSYRQDTKALQAEYDELASLREAMTFVNRCFAAHIIVTDALLVSTEAALPAWQSNLNAATEAVRQLQDEAEQGTHPWWFTWTKSWADIQARIKSLATSGRPESIRDVSASANDRAYIALQSFNTVPPAEA